MYPSWAMLTPVWLDLPEDEPIMLEYKYVRHPGPWAETGQQMIWEDKIKNRCVVLPTKPGIWKVSDARWNDNKPSQVDRIELTAPTGQDIVKARNQTMQLGTEPVQGYPGAVSEDTAGEVLSIKSFCSRFVQRYPGAAVSEDCAEEIVSIKGFCARLGAKAGKDHQRQAFSVANQKAGCEDAFLRRLPTPSKSSASPRPIFNSTHRVPLPLARRDSNISARSQRSLGSGKSMACLTRRSEGAKEVNHAAAEFDFGALVAPNRSSWEWPMSKGEKHLRLHMINQHVASLDRDAQKQIRW